MKNQTSALDLYKLVEELQEIVGAKVNKVYQSKTDFVFDFHKTGIGKIMLRMIIPDFIFITKYKHDSVKEPPKFCMFLRKYLNNAIIRSIKQANFERIIEFELETKEKKFILIAELFSKGNMILCDENYKIISPMQPQSWQARTIRGGTEYVYPPKQENPVTISFEDFKQVIEDSEMDSVVKSLATDLSLSGMYAEEACARADIDKQESTLSSDEFGALFDVVKGMFEEKIKANTVKEQVFPFAMQSLHEEPEFYKSFNEAVDELVSKKLFDADTNEGQEAKDSKVDKVKKILEEQKATIERMKKEIEVNQKKGERIFEKYQEVKELLEKINSERKEMPWEELKEKYKDNSLVRQINEKEGSITVEL